MEKDNLLNLIVYEKQTLLDALKQIDKNHRGFVLVINSNWVLRGTLTDGDIRRALIQGKIMTDLVSEVCKEQYRYLLDGEDVNAAIESFKNVSVKFLPIINRDNILINVITKEQLHALLLQDIHTNLNYNFESLDEKIVDEEIYYRPWGFYKTTMMNNYFQSKIISVNPQAQLSLQSHNYREEYWIVAHGKGIVQIGESTREIKCGSSLFIPKGCKHRLSNIDYEESLIITEVQIGDYFGEDDIIRYEDVYGRI